MFGLPPLRSCRARFWFPAVLVGLAVSGQVVCRAEPEEDDEYRDHVFFLGLDIFVLQPEGFVAVEGFDRGHVTITAEGTSRTVKLGKLEDVDSKIQPKVSSGSLVLGEVHGFRTYSPENDPTLKAIRTESRMVADQMEKEASLNESLMTQVNASAAIGALMSSSDDSIRQTAARVADAQSQQSMDKARSTGGFGSLDPVGRSGDDGASSDAYAVTCTVSSDNPIENAYAVLVTNILFPEATDSIRALAFERLPVIDESPRRVRFMQKWLPVGYRVEGYEIHTYREDGSELATNLSAKRAQLSRSEAFEFLLFQYTTSNRTNNLKPRLVRELLSSDLHLIIPRDQHDREAYLTIDDRGTVTGVRLQDGTGDPADAFIEKAIRDVYFFPALAFGEPVESEAMVTLGELVR